MSVSTEEEMIAGLVAPNEAQNGTAPAAAPNGMQDGIHPVENKEPPSWLSIPNEPFVSVEHPCIVHNIDNCIKSLGGERRLDRFLKLKDNKKSMGASLRLNDPMAQPVLSSFVKTQNLLIKVTVPKRTGRKRKRGCSDPFKFHEEVDGEKSESSEGKSEQIASRLKKKPQDLLRSMRDNPDSYKIQPVGTMEETHKFRSLPDYQYSITHNRTAQDFQEFFTKPQWSKLKNFQFDKSRYPASGAKADVGPCPQILSTSVPFNYAYRQNMYIKFHSTPHGQPLPINTSFSQKYIMHKVSPTCAPSSIPHRIPSYPPLPPESTLPDYLQNLIQDLRAALDARPIMTRRVIHNLLGRDVEYELKQAYAYVGYVFSAGPWREALVKFGVDPRSDPKYLAYQTIWFKLASKEQGAGAGVIEEEGGTGEGRRGEWMDSRIVFQRRKPLPYNNPASHIFDGETLYSDAKVWQICDITDPVCRVVLREKPSERCDPLALGFLRPLTATKLKTIMRHKIQILSNSPSLLSHGVALVPRDTPNPPQPRTIDNRDYDKVLALTAIVRGNGLVRVLRGSTDGEKEVSFLFRKMVHNFDKGSERSKRGGEMDEEEGDWGGDGGEVDEEEVEREEEDTPREDLVDEDADEEDLGLDDTAFYSDGFEEEQRDEADEDEVDEDDDEDDDEIYYNTENRVENEGVEEYESEGFEDGGLDPGTMGNTEYA